MATSTGQRACACNGLGQCGANLVDVDVTHSQTLVPVPFSPDELNLSRSDIEQIGHQRNRCGIGSAIGGRWCNSNVQGVALTTGDTCPARAGLDMEAKHNGRDLCVTASGLGCFPR